MAKGGTKDGVEIFLQCGLTSGDEFKIQKK